MSAPATSVLIRSGRPPLRETARELWEYRDLLGLLAWREISIRYKQTLLGVTWVILQPLVSALIFSQIFGRFVKVPSEGIPYFMFAYSGLVIWQLFHQGLDRASMSITADERLITKVYFPRLLIPAAAVASTSIDFLVSLGLMLPLAFFFGLTPGWNMLLIPLAALLSVFLSMGIGMLLAALNVRYRDFRYVMPFVLQIWLYVSPIVYPTSVIPESLRALYYLNPMVGVIELFRFSVTGLGHPSWSGVAISAASGLVMLTIGLSVFRKLERSFADYI